MQEEGGRGKRGKRKRRENDGRMENDMKRRETDGPKFLSQAVFGLQSSAGVFLTV